MQRILILPVFLLLASRSGFAGETEVPQLIAHKDSAIQDQIKKTIQAFRRGSRDELKTNCAGFQELQQLKKIVKGKAELVEQIAIFAMTERYEEDEQVLLGEVLLDFSEIQPSIIIRVLAPYLDAENKQLHDFANIWFQNYDSGSETHGHPPLGDVNYSEYENYVDRQIATGEETPQGFINYLYEHRPGKALLVFAYANSHGDVTARMQAIRNSIEGKLSQKERTKISQQQRAEGRARLKDRHEIELAEHIISNAIWLQKNKFNDRFNATSPEADEQLEKLSKGEWWEKLYVAYVMRQNPPLLKDDILRQLAKDENKLVSEAASSKNSNSPP